MNAPAMGKSFSDWIKVLIFKNLIITVVLEATHLQFLIALLGCTSGPCQKFTFFLELRLFLEKEVFFIFEYVSYRAYLVDKS